MDFEAAGSRPPEGKGGGGFTRAVLVGIAAVAVGAGVCFLFLNIWERIAASSSGSAPAAERVEFSHAFESIFESFRILESEQKPQKEKPRTPESVAPSPSVPYQVGEAAFYGKEFHGRKTANGETFDMHALTAAHRKLPFGARVRVTSLANGMSVVVRVNDRGPFGKGRIIDLSYGAAKEIGLVKSGVAKVKLEIVK